MKKIGLKMRHKDNDRACTVNGPNMNVLEGEIFDLTDMHMSRKGVIKESNNIHEGV